MGSIFSELKLIVQVVEIIWNAVQSYAATPQGAAELNSLSNAIDMLDGVQGNMAQTGGLAGAASSTLDQARANVAAQQSASNVR